MPKILIVEDEPDMQFLCVRFFESLGYSSLGVATKGELYNNLRSFQPDVILLDIMLGAEDGRKICREIKDSHRHIKVILVSAREDLLESFQECGADFSYAKPYSIKIIARKIAELMNGK